MQDPDSQDYTFQDQVTTGVSAVMKNQWTVRALKQQWQSFSRDYSMGKSIHIHPCAGCYTSERSAGEKYRDA